MMVINLDQSHLLYLYVNKKPTFLGRLRFKYRMNKLKKAYLKYIDTLDVISYEDLRDLSKLKTLSVKISDSKEPDKSLISFDSIDPYSDYKWLKFCNTDNSIFVNLSFYIGDKCDDDIRVTISTGNCSYNTGRHDVLDFNSISHTKLDMSKSVIDDLMLNYRKTLKENINSIFLHLLIME